MHLSNTFAWSKHLGGQQKEEHGVQLLSCQESQWLDQRYNHTLLFAVWQWWTCCMELTIIHMDYWLTVNSWSLSMTSGFYRLREQGLRNLHINRELTWDAESSHQPVDGSHQLFPHPCPGVSSSCSNRHNQLSSYRYPINCSPPPHQALSFMEKGLSYLLNSCQGPQTSERNFERTLAAHTGSLSHYLIWILVLYSQGSSRIQDTQLSYNSLSYIPEGCCINAKLQKLHANILEPVWTWDRRFQK